MNTRIDQNTGASLPTSSESEALILDSVSSFAGAGSPEELVATVMIMLDRSVEQNRQQRRDAQRAQREAVKEQVEAMLEEADDNFYSSISGAVGQAASGTLKIGAAAEAYDAARSGAHAAEARARSQEPSDKFGVEASKLQKHEAEHKYYAGRLEGAAEIVNGAGAAIGGAFQRAAGRSRAEQTALGDVAKSHGERADEYAEDVKADERGADRASEILEGIEQAVVQGRMAAVRG